VSETAIGSIPMPEVDDVVRIRECVKVFGGCHALVKAVEGRQVEVRILAPSMTGFEGTFRFDINEISLSRQDWP
jgi:hypothetical protein